MASGWSGSTSSFNSGAPPSSQGQHASPLYSTWTPTSAAISALTSESSVGPNSPLGPLDLGPPGYFATIKLYERTPNEITVYLGPWEIVETNSRRVVWQCSYQGETLEHFLPSAELYPHTLHAQHRRFGDPRELELHLSFLEPHRVRYVTRDGVVCDDYVEIQYELTTIEASIQLQSDIRTRDLIDWFDVDVVWSDQQRRTDSYGNVRGLGTIQRMKLWRDRYSSLHYITFYANHRRRYKEYMVDDFEREFRQRDDRHRRLQLSTRSNTRRDSTSGSSGHSRERRFSAASIFGSRRSSSAQANGGSVMSSSHGGHEIRFLGIQFSRNMSSSQSGNDDFLRFIAQWELAHTADSQFGAAFPTNHTELPGTYVNGTAASHSLPYMNGDYVNGIAELPSPDMHGLAPVLEPPGGLESDVPTP
ncbi:hypothetical protein QBC42DRAFT_47512 [Cladorrhinum samala]|uniref:Acetate kinase n=1 Tax=Cladorrhinum samala TaxID=585594 RepID=A0AAV9HBV7_9PEZI|nr:hypothetical protein QBC42DRAFT_47512 [Cladorrhinum samala]